jgi:hypothetical protein
LNLLQQAFSDPLASAAARPPSVQSTHVNVPGSCQLLAAPLVISARKEYQLSNSSALGSLRKGSKTKKQVSTWSYKQEKTCSLVMT